MITLFHFIGLDINKRAEYVWQGTYLDMRTEGRHRILLYNLGEFYAEVFYDVTTNEISYIKGFKAISHLAPYIILRK